MTAFIRKMTSRRARRGATALEYALVLAFVAVAVTAALALLSDGLDGAMRNVGTQVGTINTKTF